MTIYVSLSIGDQTIDSSDTLPLLCLIFFSNMSGICPYFKHPLFKDYVYLSDTGRNGLSVALYEYSSDNSNRTFQLHENCSPDKLYWRLWKARQRASLLTEIDSPFQPEIGADHVKGRGYFHKFSRKGGLCFHLNLHCHFRQSQPFLEDIHSSPDLIQERANLASPDSPSSRGAAETHQISISLSPPWSGFLVERPSNTDEPFHNAAS